MEKGVGEIQEKEVLFSKNILMYFTRLLIAIGASGLMKIHLLWLMVILVLWWDNRVLPHKHEKC